MSVKVYREEIVMTADGEQFEVETWGELHLMPRQAHSVFAHFGLFERMDNGHLLYTMDCEMMDIDSCDSHYMDDLKALKVGNFELVDLRSKEPHFGTDL